MAVIVIVSISSCMTDMCLCPSECSMTEHGYTNSHVCVYVYLCVCP